MPCTGCAGCDSLDCYGRKLSPAPAQLVKICEALDIERNNICLDVSVAGDGTAVIEAFVVVAYRDRLQDCETIAGEEVPIHCQVRYEECRWFEDGLGRILSGSPYPCVAATNPPPACVATDIPLNECLFLVSLYTNNGGALWTDNTNWTSDPTAGTWFGLTVTANNTQFVDLNSNNLTGAIPSDWSTLVELRRLNLDSNSLTGSPPTVPDSIFVIDLDSNGLTGSIPTAYGSLPNLTSLSLAANNLTGGIPSELGNLTNLVTLRLQSNTGLGGSIPVELGNLSNLQTLTLQNTGLTGTIPTEFSGLTSIVSINLSTNNFSGGIPTELTTLTTLEFLTISTNTTGLGAIPSGFGSLPALRSFVFQNSGLTGDIPVDLANAFTIETLTFTTNAGLTGSNAFVTAIYNNRTSYTFATPSLSMSGIGEALTGNYVAPPAVGVSDSDWSWNATTLQHDPLTGKATAYALVNDPNGEGTFNLWTIVF